MSGKKDHKGLECKFATFCQSTMGDDDLLVVKENIHHKDGTVEPNLRFIKNYEREFWVTKPGFQKHKDKKEWELESRCRRHKTRQSKLREAVAKATGNPGAQQGLRYLARNPYLYGADISTTAILKHEYQTKWPDCISPESSVAVLDIEADVVFGHGDVLSVSLTYKEKAFLAVTKEFLGNITSPEEKIQKALVKYLGKTIKERNINLEIMVVDSPAHACVEAIRKAHEWGPDFVTIWNMNYDVPKIVNMIEKGGYDPKDVFSDPSVPPEFRFYKYKEGAAQKVTAKGKVLPLHPADRWHTATFPAKWYIVDAMCIYKRIRIVKGNEPNYKLDGVLERNLGVRKLNFKEAEHVADGSLAWHQLMQREFKIEYLIYNLFDCISVEMLDELTGDISRAFNVLAGISDFSNFASNPRRICDDLHFFCREKGLVIATTSDQMVDELDKYVTSMDDWINCVC